MLFHHDRKDADLRRWWLEGAEDLLVRHRIATSNAPVGAITLRMVEGERPVGCRAGVMYLAPRHVQAAAFGSVPHRTSRATTVRVGGAVSTARPERATGVALGTVTVTDQRVYFGSDARAGTWWWRDVAELSRLNSGYALPQVNSTAVYGLRWPWKEASEFSGLLETGWARYRRDQAAQLQDLRVRMVGFINEAQRKGFDRKPEIAAASTALQSIVREASAQSPAAGPAASGTAPTAQGLLGPPPVLAAPEGPRASAAVEVAGHPRPDAVGRIRAYLTEHAQTVVKVDLLAGQADELSPALVTATRSPWLNSRVSRSEEAWLLDSGLPRVGAIPRSARLADADPREVGGLYDAAQTCWSEMMRDAPSGFARAKASKVLYMLRPHLFPILDSHLAATYATAAAAGAVQLARQRPDAFVGTRYAYWAAIRTDILASRTALGELRRQLESDAGLGRQAAQQLSDVRLLDMLAW